MDRMRNLSFFDSDEELPDFFIPERDNILRSRMPDREVIVNDSDSFEMLRAIKKDSGRKRKTEEAFKVDDEEISSVGEGLPERNLLT